MPEPARQSHPRESGQAIILIVFGFIGLLAAVGIVVDLGRYLVLQPQLRRAVDAAARAGASQVRLAGSTATEAEVWSKVNAAAKSSLGVTGVATATINCVTCTIVDTAYTDPSLSPPPPLPPTKQVRVRVHEELPLVFLRLVGIESAGV